MEDGNWTEEGGDRDKLIEVFNFYIKEWDLYERYLPKHQDKFMETAINNASYNSHPVELDAEDFKWIFEVTLERGRNAISWND